MKLIVLCDSHAGVRNDSGVFLDNAKKFYDNVLFPAMDERGIKKILHLGDILDRRKFINFLTAYRLRKDLLEPARDRGIEIDHVLGNHDVYFKETNEVSGVVEMFGHTTFPITIIDSVQERLYGELPILLVPWITLDNRDDSITKIKASRARVCMGHLELNGFDMGRGSIMDHGMDSDIFEQFEVAASGHFHSPSQRGSIRYLGAMGQYDWGDADSPRGAHIFDTDTLEFEFLANPYEMFHKIEYDDTDITEDDLNDLLNIPDWIKDTYVKVIVNGKTNPSFFSKFISAIEDVGVTDLSIEERYITIELDKTIEIAAQSENTRDIINEYVDNMNTNVDREGLRLLMEDLYKEALMNSNGAH